MPSWTGTSSSATQTPSSARLPFSSLSKLLLITILITSGCATRQARLDEFKLDDIGSWTAKGKLGLRHKNESSSANFSWQNHHPDFEIRLSGPFGRGAVRLSKQDNQVTFADSTHTLTATSPEALLQDTLGWTLPVSELEWWIRGLPSPNFRVAASTSGQSGKLLSLQQQGWKITFKDYQQVGGHMLPHKIIARHAQARLALIIKSWSLKKPGQRT